MLVSHVDPRQQRTSGHDGESPGPHSHTSPAENKVSSTQMCLASFLLGINPIRAVTQHVLPLGRKRRFVHRSRLDWDAHGSSGRYVRKRCKPLKVRTLTPNIFVLPLISSLQYWTCPFLSALHDFQSQRPRAAVWPDWEDVDLRPCQPPDPGSVSPAPLLLLLSPKQHQRHRGPNSGAVAVGAAATVRTGLSTRPCSRCCLWAPTSWLSGTV